MKCPEPVTPAGKPSCKSAISGSKFSEKSYAPSPFQFMEYCMSKQHWKCPFYSGLSWAYKEDLYPENSEKSYST